MRRFVHLQYWWLFVAATVCLHVIGLCLADERAKRNFADSAGSVVDVQRLSRVLSDIAYAGKAVKDALSKAWQSVSKLKIFQKKNKKVVEPVVPTEP